MRVRKEEMAAVLSILEDATFEDGEAMAKAILDKVYDLFRERDWYGLRWCGMAFGPYIDKGEASRAAKALGNAPVVNTLRGRHWIDRAIANSTPESDSRYCAACEHPRVAHFSTRPFGCIVKGCICDERFS